MVWKKKIIFTTERDSSSWRVIERAISGMSGAYFTIPRERGQSTLFMAFVNKVGNLLLGFFSNFGFFLIVRHVQTQIIFHWVLSKMRKLCAGWRGHCFLIYPAPFPKCFSGEVDKFKKMRKQHANWICLLLPHFFEVGFEAASLGNIVRKLSPIIAYLNRGGDRMASDKMRKQCANLSSIALPHFLKVIRDAPPVRNSVKEVLPSQWERENYIEKNEEATWRFSSDIASSFF